MLGSGRGKKLWPRGWRSDDTHERELEDRCKKHRCQRIEQTFMLCAANFNSRSPVFDHIKKQTNFGDSRSRKMVVDGKGRFFNFFYRTLSYQDNKSVPKRMCLGSVFWRSVSSAKSLCLLRELHLTHEPTKVSFRSSGRALKSWSKRSNRSFVRTTGLLWNVRSSHASPSQGTFWLCIKSWLSSKGPVSMISCKKNVQT